MKTKLLYLLTGGVLASLFLLSGVAIAATLPRVNSFQAVYTEIDKIIFRISALENNASSTSQGVITFVSKYLPIETDVQGSIEGFKDINNRIIHFTKKDAQSLVRVTSNENFIVSGFGNTTCTIRLVIDGQPSPIEKYIGNEDFSNQQLNQKLTIRYPVSWQWVLDNLSAGQHEVKLTWGMTSNDNFRSCNVTSQASMQVEEIK